MQRHLLTVEQAAQRLGLTDRGVRKMIERGSLPNAFRLDPNSSHSPFRIPVHDVEEIEKQRLEGVKRNG